MAHDSRRQEVSNVLVDRSDEDGVFREIHYNVDSHQIFLQNFVRESVFVSHVGVYDVRHRIDESKAIEI